jgi:hypothetical protein
MSVLELLNCAINAKLYRMMCENRVRAVVSL